MKKFGLTEKEIREIIQHLPLPLAILVAEEIAREVSKGISQTLITKITTKIHTIVDKEFSGEFEIISVKGRGTIRELIIITNSPNYVFHTMVDNLVVFNNPYEELSKISPLVEDLDIVQEDNNYILRIAKINFINEFRCVVKSSQSVKIIKALVLYDLTI